MDVEVEALGTVPAEDERAYVGVNFMVDADGNIEFTSISWLGARPRELQVNSVERLAPAGAYGHPLVYRWEISVGRSRAKRMLYCERGRYFVRDPHAVRRPRVRG